MVDAEHFNPTDLSIAAQVTKIKSLAPQAIIVWAVGTPFGTAVHGMHEGGLDIPTAATSAVAINAQLKQYVGLLPKDLYFIGLSYAGGVARTPGSAAAQKSFNEAMKAAGITPDLQAGLPWDVGLVVVDALRHTGTSATPDQVRTYIENLHDFPGITGVYDFRDGSQRGLTYKDAVMIQWQPATGDWTAASGFGGSL
jgi:branched-chain amino acid transport system substrate-binding protein